MKPTKNQFFCLAAGRAKMLFESEAKAQNFIRYNAQDMINEGKKAPVRIYYCSHCCGWHVTSNPHVEMFAQPTHRERVINHVVEKEKERKAKKAVRATETGTTPKSEKIYQKAVGYAAHYDMGALLENIKKYRDIATESDDKTLQQQLCSLVLYAIQQITSEMTTKRDNGRSVKPEKRAVWFALLKEWYNEAGGDENTFKAVEDDFNTELQKTTEAYHIKQKQNALVNLRIKALALSTAVDNGTATDTASLHQEIEQIANRLLAFADDAHCRNEVKDIVNLLWHTRENIAVL